MLDSEEQVILAAILREVARADGILQPSESDALARVAARLDLSAAEWQARWSEANRRYPNPQATREAAQTIQRLDAQEVVYRIAYEVAEEGEIVDPEWDLLEWLDEAWLAGRQNR